MSVGLLVASVWPFRWPQPASNQPLRVVDSLDLAKYAGRWYKVARFPNKFQDQCAGDVVAHYNPRADGRIDVVNRCRTASGND